MKTLFAILVVFIALQTARAADSTPPTDITQSIPASMLQMQRMSAQQGTCQASWTDMANSDGILRTQLDDTYEVWMLPCARWAYNYGWTVYVTIQESTQPEGFITKAIRFVNYSPFEGVVARDLVHNFQWDPKTQTITAQYFMNGSTTCGTKSQYKWDRGQQNFLLIQLLKQDDCNDASKPWEPVLR